MFEQMRLAAVRSVLNQVGDLVDYNLFLCDPVLQSSLDDGVWHTPDLTAFGTQLGSAQVQEWAALANRFEPELRTHDRVGNRVDEVRFHPAWHELLSLLREQCVQALPFAMRREGAWTARAASFFLQAQMEAGALCPVTMTFASIPVLQKEAALFGRLKPLLYACEHDSRDIPYSSKRSMMVGMGMTERQGGSDVRSNMTLAFPVEKSGRGAVYRLVGHKWFFSAPMCDAHLVTARVVNESNESGPLCCFFVPRFWEDGSKNAIRIQRLKDKLGNRSNASAEVEFHDALGIMVGEEGRGVATMMEMATLTRLDCVIGSAAMMRQAFVQAWHYARHRQVFGRALAHQPLMRSVLVDLALESEAATRLMMWLAQAFERAESDPLCETIKRVLTPAAKFWICKRAMTVCAEAMEVWGGNGYVEDAPLARLYREAPVNSIWEGSGNVMCLDVLRAMQRDEEGTKRLLAFLREACSRDGVVRVRLQELEAMLRKPVEEQEAQARWVAQWLVLIVQAVLMRQRASSVAANVFIASRLGGDADGRVMGVLPSLGETEKTLILEQNWV